MSNSLYKNGDIIKLVELAQKNDVKAIEALIRSVQKHVYAIFSHLTSKKEDISDLTQETLIKMAKNINKLKDAKCFNQWLNKIITNSFYDFIRKKRLQTVEVGENKLNEIRDKIGCEPGEKCIFSEIESLIKHALMILPHNLRLSLILREYEGLSYEDISKLTNTTIGTVKSRISRARTKLREELDGFI